MKKTTILICAILVLMSVIPVQAKPFEPTGDQISLRSEPYLEFPANTPFYIAHGWYKIITKPEFPPYRYDFRLELDGEYIDETFIDRIVDNEAENRDILLQWTFNFPDGMTGEHTFTGHWYLSCTLALQVGAVTECQQKGALIDVMQSVVTVSFYTP